MSPAQHQSSSTPPTFTSELSTPAHATSVAFDDAEETLAVGSDDGSVRLYRPPGTKVIKAIRGLEDTVSGIVFGSTEGNAIFAAAGHSIFQFSLDTSKLILNREDAVSAVDSRDESTEDDALNNIAIDAGHTRIAFTLDSGSVGVLDIGTGLIKRMRPKHTAIAYVVAFIPDRPNEIVSGGYDCALLHYNVKEGTLMSRFDFPSTAPFAPGISRSPPFVTSLSLSTTGGVAAGCADGRVWVSRSGEHPAVENGAQAVLAGNAKKKKGRGKKGEVSKRWRGLDIVDKEDGRGEIMKVADGLVPALQFKSPEALLVSSLSGELSRFDVRPSNQSAVTVSDQDQASIPQSDNQPFQTLWNTKLQTCAKVNAIALAPRTGWLVAAGLDKSLKKGVVEVWTTATGQMSLISESVGLF